MPYPYRVPDWFSIGPSRSWLLPLPPQIEACARPTATLVLKTIPTTHPQGLELAFLVGGPFVEAENVSQ